MSSGSAYIFERNAGGADAWCLVAKLTADDGNEGDDFGCSVSMSGTTPSQEHGGPTARSQDRERSTSSRATRANRVPSGLYFIRLEAAGASWTIKVLKLR